MNSKVVDFWYIRIWDESPVPHTRLSYTTEAEAREYFEELRGCWGPGGSSGCPNGFTYRLSHRPTGERRAEPETVLDEFVSAG